MQPKAPGFVPCAHCSRPGAVEPCASCTHLVCADCRLDWTTCPQPCGQEIRLGLGARLRELSHSGRLGIVVGWRGDLHILDLRRVRYVDTRYRLASTTFSSLLGSALGLLLTRDGRLVRERWEWSDASQNRFRVFAGFDVEELANGYVRTVRVEQATSPLEASGPVPHSLRLTRDDRLVWYERSNETVQIVDLETRASHNLSPVSGQVIQRAYVDAASGRIATGTYGAVHVHRFSGAALTELGVAPCPDDDILAIELAGSRLLVVSGRAHIRATLRVFELAGDRVAARPIHERSVDGPVACALSARGDYAAVSRADHAVELHAVGGEMIELGGHSDTVRLVRFARSDDELVTADDDNRIIIRPRTSAGFARATVAVELPSEPIEMPDLAVAPD